MNSFMVICKSFQLSVDVSVIDIRSLVHSDVPLPILQKYGKFYLVCMSVHLSNLHEVGSVLFISLYSFYYLHCQQRKVRADQLTAQR